MRILVADDDKNLRRALEILLIKEGHEVILASDGMSALKILQSEDAPKLAILDRRMPGMDGMDIVKIIREQKGKHYIYIILLTAMYRCEDVISGIDAGADDYISKPFDSNELMSRIRAGIRIIDLQEELALKSISDSLTGLWHHGEIIRIMERELSRAERDGVPVGVIMSDIDHFKKINDTYGHPIGDKVILEVCRLMKSLLRPYDHIGRYGGEEFLTVVPECDEQGIISLAERLCEAIRSKGIVTAEGIIPVTISAGIAISRKGMNAAELVKHADTALYMAKEEGRDCFRLASYRGEELW